MAAAPGTTTPAAAEPARRRGPPPDSWLKPAIVTGSGAPVAEALNQLGLLTLVFVLGSLAMTPLKLVFGWSWPIRVRRVVGVTAFVYASLHFTLYAVVDQGLDLGAVLADIGNRKFIFVGFTAFLLLVPLAVTSTNRMVRRLGFERWKRIHRLAYLAGILGVLHFLMRVKKDPTEPVVYGVILGILFAIRIVAWRRRAARKRARR